MFLVFLGFALLASAIIANKCILFTLPPILFVGIRMFLAGLILVSYRYHKNHRFAWVYLKQDMIILFAISVFTTLIPSILKAYALKNLYSSKATLLGSLDPFVTAIYSYVIWHEKLSWQKIMGICLGMFGTMVLIYSTSSVEQTAMAWWVFSYPELAALAAMAIGRLGWMMVQHLVRKDRYKPTEVNGLTMLLSGVIGLAIAPIFENIWAIGPINWLSIAFYMAYTVIVGNIIAYTMYAQFLRHHSSTFISLAGFSVPIFTYIYGWAYLHEPLSVPFIVSISITLLGVILFYQQELKKGLY